MKNIMILGAGVSHEYGYPLGDSLMQQIIKELNNIKHRSGHQANLLTGLLTTTYRSIDSFLKNREDLRQEGLKQIAKILFHREKKNKLFEKSANENSYKFLFNEIITSNGEYKLDDFHFITFNYDRSLEYFLSVALVEEKVCENIEDSYKKIGKMVTHIHGRLPSLKGENKFAMSNTRYTYDYGHLENLKLEANEPIQLNTDRFMKQTLLEKQSDLKERIDSHTNYVQSYAANNFHLVYTNNETNTELLKLLNQSERIFFLGFSYHELNMKILNFQELEDFPDRKIIGTTYQMQGVQKRKLAIDYPSISQKDCTALKLFQESYSLTDRRLDER